MERRLAAIMAADVVGYSRLIRADEEGMLAHVKAHRPELWTPAIEKHGGQVVGKAGHTCHKEAHSIGLVGFAAILGLSAMTGPVLAQVDDVAIFATHSAWLKDGSTIVSGSVIVNEAGVGPFLTSGFELTIGVNVTTPAGFTVKADTLKIKSSAVVNGDVFCNELTDNSNSVTCQFLTLPAVQMLPIFIAEAPAAGSPDVLVLVGGSDVLEPGDYGEVKVKKYGTLTFTGGIYNIRTIDFGTNVDIYFDAESQIRVEEKFAIDQNSSLGPSAGANIAARDIIFFVAGINGSNGNLGSTPKAAKIGVSVEAQANFNVPNGTLEIRHDSIITGAFQAKDVNVGPDVSVTLDSAFDANAQPTADAQTVSTGGATLITIDLTGSNADGDDLEFSIVAEPVHGEVTLDQAPGGSPDTAATATYTPNDAAANLLDSFTFAVHDGRGGTASAVVKIN